MSTPPLPSEFFDKQIKFISSESFDILIKEKKYILKISFNNEILGFDILEENSIRIKEFSLYHNIEELKKIDKFFGLFDNIEEIFNSLKRLISSKNLELIEEENQIKIKILNTLTNKHFYMNIPIKNKAINKSIDHIIIYIESLNKRVTNLENQVKENKNKNNI